MKLLFATASALLLLLAAGCGSGGGDTGLLGRLPGGYDAYITVDPDKADVAMILEIVEDNLPDYELDDIEDADLGLDVFDWEEWKDELGIEPGEIGVIGLSEDMDFLAFFLPCGDGEKLREFVENAGGGGETEFLQMEEYTVMVIAWEDDDQIDDLEDALEGESIAEDQEFTLMAEKAFLNEAAVSFVFFSEITEVPVMGFVSQGGNETEMSVAVILDDNEVAEYSAMFGDGMQSSSIMFPRNTMAAVRTSMDMEELAHGYADIADGSGADVADVETGLAFIGFDSMEEFIGTFQGDFCIALTELEMDDSGEPEGGAGVMALSLADAEKLESSLAMISTLAEADRENFGDYTAYSIEIDRDELWFFISDDVFYVTYNVDPDDVTNGSKASDFFTGSSQEGFMGGAADPEMVVEGLSLDRDTRELIEDVFAGNADFSVSFDGDLAYSRVTVGAGAIGALVSLAMQMQ